MSYLHDLFFLDTFQFKFFHHNIYVKYRNYDYSEFRYINTLPIIFFLLLVKLQVSLRAFFLMTVIESLIMIHNIWLIIFEP